jgi:hypothetical protein
LNKYCNITVSGNYTLKGDEILSAALDIVGIVDPTGIADALNASLSASNGNWGDAMIAGVGIIPYAGDLAKAGKIKKDINIIENAIDAVKGTDKAKKAKKAEGIVYKRIDKTKKEKDYIGQVKSEKRYNARQKEHGRANPDADYEFQQIDRARPGRSLDKKEQKHLDLNGGPTNKSNPNGGTSNKKNVIRKKKS